MWNLEEFLVMSNINSWLICRETNSGSLTAAAAGSIECDNVHDASSASSKGCSGRKPDTISWGSYGPSLSIKGKSLFYYWSVDIHALICTPFLIS